MERCATDTAKHHVQQYCSRQGYGLDEDSEMDAFAFSLAVMKYKYKDVSTLFVPKCYGAEFFEIVDSWINTFEKEQV